LKAENEETREKWVTALQEEMTSNPAERKMQESSSANNPNSPIKVYLPPPLHRGWLKKRGEVNTAWRRRYFALFPHDAGQPEDSGPILYYVCFCGFIMSFIWSICNYSMPPRNWL